MTAASTQKTVSLTPPAVVDRIRSFPAPGDLDMPPVPQPFPSAGDALDRLARISARLLRAPLAQISLIEDEQLAAERCYCVDRPCPPELPLPRSLWEQVIRTGEMIALDSVAHPPASSSFALHELPLPALALCPIPTADRGGVGVLCVADVRERAWTEEELGLLAQMAADIGAELTMLSQIAECTRMIEEVRQSEGRFRAYLEHASDILTVLDEQGGIRYESPSIQHTLGYSPEELIGRSAFELIHPEDLARVMDAFRAGVVAPGATLSVEYRFRHKDGSWRALESRGTNALANTAVRGVIVSSRDISERKQAEAQLAAHAEELRALSLTDELTGLSNRRGFFSLGEHKLKLAQRTGNRVVLLFADVDDVKGINDTLGHAAGDQVLRDAARVLTQVFRAGDIVARMGGDEFAVLAWTNGHGSAETLINRLEIGLLAHHADTDRPYSLSMSIGAAEWDRMSPGTIVDLLQEADARMYEIKRTRYPHAGHSRSRTGAA